MQNKKLVISIAAGLLILLVGVGGMKFMAAQKTLPEQKPLEAAIKYVKAVEVNNSQQMATLHAHGRVTTSQPLDLLTEVPGKIEQGNLPLKTGQSFRKGDVLFQVDRKIAELNLKAQKSSFLNTLSAILPDLKIDYPDSYALWQDYFNHFDIHSSIKDLPEIKSIKEKTFLASKNILTSYYNIKSEEERFKKHMVRAPYTGTFTNVFLESGSFANVNTRVASIIRTDLFEIELPIDFKTIHLVQVGAVVKLSDNDGRKWDGKVSRISGHVNPNTQAISVFVTIQNAQSTPVYDGLYLKAEIATKAVNNAYELPRAALFDKNKVFLIADNKLKAQEVNIVQLGEQTALVTGIENGALLVPEPIINGTDNMEVKIIEP